jgi:hypothetical protein
MSAEGVRRGLLGALGLVCLALQFGGSLAGSSGALGVWLLALLVLDRRALRRLWLPRFWLVGLVFVAAAALLLEPRDLEVAGLGVSSRGLRTGALMLVRGTLIFGLAVVASRALGGAGWLRWCRRLGVERLGEAVRVAFGLLPELQRELRRAGAATAGRPARRGRLGGVHEAAVRLVVRTARLAERLGRGPTGDGSRTGR